MKIITKFKLKVFICSMGILLLFNAMGIYVFACSTLFHEAKIPNAFKR